MRAALPLVLALMTALGGPTAAQEATLKETRCWAGGVTFSAGAGISAGNGVTVCQAGIGWHEAEPDAPVAGCLLEGKLSSAGAIIGVRNTDNMLLRCDETGRWNTVEPGAPS